MRECGVIVDEHDDGRVEYVFEQALYIDAKEIAALRK